MANLIKDGGFEKGNWNVNNNTTLFVTDVKKSGNYSLKLIGNSAGSEVTSTYKEPYKLEENHKYYVSAFVKDENTSANQLGFYYQLGEPSAQLYKTGFIENGWYKYSSCFNITNYKYNLYIRVDNDNKGGNRTVYFDEWYLVDLTSTFGAGNEPNKEWCDANLGYGVTQVAAPTN